MMNFGGLVKTVLVGCFLAGCAAPGPATYGPAGENGFGFSEQRIESDRFRVIYRGSAGMAPEQVEDFALLRAAELTLENGFDWFRVAGRDVVAEDRGGVSLGAGLGSGSYGRRGGVSVGVGGDLGTVGGRRYFSASMEILLGQGDPPADDFNVYDARSVVSNARRASPDEEASR